MAKNKEKFNDYDGFVEKFKPKKTTDDCYTPPEVYDVVLKHVREKYHIADDVPIVRPFYPGGDYEHYDYPEGCVVVDNPPFSIFARILDFYQARGIRFFLFAPHLTAISAVHRRHGITFISTNVSVVYQNGADVKTGFVTNLSPDICWRTDPSLYEVVKSSQNIAKVRHRSISLPPEVFNVKKSNYLSYCGGVDCELYWREVIPSNRCSSTVKNIFGGAFLMCRTATDRMESAMKAAAMRTAERAAERATKPSDVYLELEEHDRQLLAELNSRSD